VTGYFVMRFRSSRFRRRRRGAIAPYLLVAALVAAGIALREHDGGARRPQPPQPREAVRGAAPAGTIAGRAIAIDGDTLAIARRRIRLVGIDAPEKGQRCGGARDEYDCGEAATRALAALVRTGSVECRAEDRDRWGRIVARCQAGGRDLGAAILRAGWAKAARGAPAGYAALEAEARAARRGAWQGAFEDPARWRHGHPR
jgi:endonuclease YncB( thermonuclease family)